MVELLIRQPGYPDRVVTLATGQSYIGRAEDNTIILADIGVSRRHAIIIVNGEQVRVEDMGSGNGTYFHGQRIERQILADGDELIIDPFVLRFRVRSASASASVWDSEGARLDIIQSDTDPIASYPIGPRGVTIGRSETRDIVVTDPAASRHHCTIFQKDHGYLLRDMGSANGIYLNDQRVREHKLVNNDIIRIGNTEMRLVLGDSTKVAAAPAPPKQVALAPPKIPMDSPTDLSLSTRSDPAFSEVERSTRPNLTHQLHSNVLPLAIGALMALGVLGLLALMSGLGLFVWLDFSAHQLAPPIYTLNLPNDLPTEKTDALSANAIKALKQKDFKRSFELLYRAQLLQPKNVYLLHASYTVAEFYLLKELEPLLQASATQRKESEQRRDALLHDARRNNSRGRAAKKTLLAEFRDDPAVVDALKLDQSDESLSLQRRYNEGVKALNAKDFLKASAVFQQIRKRTQNSEQLAESQLGLDNAARGLAMQIAKPWREGIIAQAQGDDDEARRLFSEAIAIDPTNVSLAIHLKQLQPPSD